MLYEEKILPLGKDITAVGICSLNNGAFEIKASKDLPCFLYVDLPLKTSIDYALCVSLLDHDMFILSHD